MGRTSVMHARRGDASEEAVGAEVQTGRFQSKAGKGEIRGDEARVSSRLTRHAGMGGQGGGEGRDKEFSSSTFAPPFASCSIALTVTKIRPARMGPTV